MHLEAKPRSARRLSSHGPFMGPSSGHQNSERSGFASIPACTTATCPRGTQHNSVSGASMQIHVSHGGWLSASKNPPLMSSAPPSLRVSWYRKARMRPSSGTLGRSPRASARACTSSSTERRAVSGSATKIVPSARESTSRQAGRMLVSRVAPFAEHHAAAAASERIGVLEVTRVRAPKGSGCVPATGPELPPSFYPFQIGCP